MSNGNVPALGTRIAPHTNRAPLLSSLAGSSSRTGTLPLPPLADTSPRLSSSRAGVSADPYADRLLDLRDEWRRGWLDESEA